MRGFRALRFRSKNVNIYAKAAFRANSAILLRDGDYIRPNILHAFFILGEAAIANDWLLYGATNTFLEANKHTYIYVSSS